MIAARHSIRVSPGDVAMMHAVEQFILPYRSDDLLRDIELAFPNLSYRIFFLGLMRARDPARWLEPEGAA
jgi:hypothetical protein